MNIPNTFKGFVQKIYKENIGLKQWYFTELNYVDSDSSEHSYKMWRMWGGSFDRVRYVIKNGVSR